MPKSSKHYKLKIVKPYCRHPPASRGMGKTAHEQGRSREVARHYREREIGAWHRGVSRDLIDTHALTDRTLTKRENARLLRDLPKQFR